MIIIHLLLLFYYFYLFHNRYEMMHGRTPFFDKNRKLMFYKIINTEPNFPATFSPEACTCIRGLLCVNEQDRLSSGDVIMKTDFFRSIDFELLDQRKIKPPFKPDVDGELDTKYVPKAYLQTEAKDSFSEPAKRGEPNPKFEAFTFSGEKKLDA